MKRIEFLRVMRGRRGLALIGLTLALIIGLTLWGFDRLYGPRLTEAQVVALARWRNSEWSQRASLAELQKEGERYYAADAFYDGRRQWWVIQESGGEWWRRLLSVPGEPVPTVTVYEWTVDERTRRVVPRNAEAKKLFSRQPIMFRSYEQDRP